MVNLSEIADKIAEWANSKDKGDIYQARFVADRDDPSVMQVELWPSEATSSDQDLRQLEQTMLAYSHWAKHLFNLGNDRSAVVLNQRILECATAIDATPGFTGYFSSEITRARRSRVTPGIEWQSTLKRKRSGELYVHTKVPWRSNPRIMAPASVLTVFDHLMDSLGDEWRVLFLVGVGAMHNYYTAQGHTGIHQINEGPLRGLLGIARAVNTLLEKSGS